ncbi:MAG: hypothetical protein CV087_10505 [Candidatus Brocadia sp. WS118]|nr:MAG: hypothetical protein CV087_10505 [Candidatus Brocadia sp. WS118]
MKSPSFLTMMLACLFFWTGSYGQIPSWEDIVLSFNETHQYYDPDYPPDVEANGAGIHYAFENANGDIRYYLLGNDGAVIESFTLDQGQRPVVAPYQNDVYVLYFKNEGGNLLIKGKTRNFDGQNWTAWTEIQSFLLSDTPDQTDAVMDDNGLHLVWSENGSRVWYNLYLPFPSNQWVNLKNVTDHPDTPYGKFPTVTISSDWVHIGYSGWWEPLGGGRNAVNRDFQFSTSSWKDPELIDNEGDWIDFNNVIVSEGHLHTLYTVAEFPFTTLYWSKRSANGGNWTMPLGLAGDKIYPYFGRRVTVDNQHLHLSDIALYNTQYTIFYQRYSETVGWELLEFIAFPDNVKSGTATSNNQNGVFVMWVTSNGFDPDINYFRRKPKAIFDDVTEHSLWTGKVWIGDTQQPREVINIPAGVTVTLDGVC